LAFVVVGRAGGLGGVLKGTVAPVKEEEIWAHVVGDVEVDQAIAVQVGGDGRETAAIASGLGLFGLGVDGEDGVVVDVGEGKVAIVAVEQVLGGPDGVWRAVAPEPVWLEPTTEPVILGELPDAVVGDVEVEVAVVVVVEERPARGPVGSVDPRRLADVPERPVAIVQEEDVRSVVTEKDVRIPVVVDVADDAPVSEAPVAVPGRRGHVLELVPAEVLE